MTTALGGRVLLDVAVEQQQRDAADLGAPHVRVQGAALRQRHGDDRGRAVGLAQQLDRQAVRVQRGVVLELPAVGRQALGEVPGPVEQPDADQRDAEVRGGLEVVTGEDAQAAGVLRQHLGDPELGGEVGDARRRLGAERLVPARLGEVLLQVVHGVLQPADELAVLGQLRQPLGRHLAEHLDRVAAAALPERRIERLEEIPRLGVPGPAEVPHQLGEGRQRLGKSCSDGESTECAHRARLTALCRPPLRARNGSRQEPHAPRRAHVPSHSLDGVPEPTHGRSRSAGQGRSR